MTTHDTIILGIGGMGSAAACHFARRGQRVLGIEQFDIAHDRGSSHGDTRIIRRAYFEHPDYVPLVDRAYEMWRELETVTGRQLHVPTGLVILGPPDGAILPGVRNAARTHNLDIVDIPLHELSDRFPGLHAEDGMVALFERDAGILRVEDCVRAHVELARSHGAEIVTGQRVRDWSADRRGVTVTTDAGTHAAGTLVICAGPWTKSTPGRGGHAAGDPSKGRSVV